MRRLLAAACGTTLALGLLATGAPASDSPVRGWSGDVPAAQGHTGGCALITTSVLRPGHYVVDVQGTFAPDPYEGREADARWATESYWEGHSDSPTLGLELNGSRPEWGAYNDSHAYSLPVVHPGGPMTFRIRDTDNCGDNPPGGLFVNVRLDDSDGDGASNAEEAAACGRAALATAINTVAVAGECASASDLTVIDADDDGTADSADNCPGLANGDQADDDGNGIGDACQPVSVPGMDSADGDADGVPDAAEPAACLLEDQTTGVDGSCSGDDYSPPV